NSHKVGIGKQENIRQDVKGGRNIVLGTGDAYIEEHHHHYPRTPQGIPLQRPRQPDHLVGREELLKEVLTALQPGKAVTLCGPGGMGKTALASRAAWELSPDGRPPARFPDGLIFYSFYGRKDVGLAFDHLMRSYVDDSQDNSPEAVRQLLAGKQALIILDGAEEADDLLAVLRCCGGCGVLITSRKRSDAPGSLLEVKRLDELPAAEAFRLYSGTDADKATIQAVCEQLGGWPLALRIAGHYLRSTGESAAEYLRWLEKEPLKELGDGQHQEENAALLLRRSVAQVSGNAQQALSLFGVLAFEPVARAPMAAVLEDDERRARKALGELVNYGLLETREERWQISHALVHTYARTELPLSREDLERVTEYYIWFCTEQSKAGLEGYARLDEERAHCLRLIESCFNRELWEEMKDLVGVIDIYLEQQGWWIEELAALEKALIASQQTGDRKGEDWCLNSLGYTCTHRGDYEKALACYKQCLPIQRKLDNRQREGTTLNNIAEIHRQQGKHELALHYYEQSLRIQRETGNLEEEGTTLNNIGLLYMNQGDDIRALEYYEQALPIARKVGNKIGEAYVLNNIALIYLEHDDPAKCLGYHQQSLAIRQQLGDRNGEAGSCWNIGITYIDLGDLAKAEEYITQAVQIEEAIGHPNLENDRKYLAHVRAVRQGVKEA
ncbi:MAG: tetratricopeptide repeat protein, partial [Planctomycetes bacterium]|nr:tetratricopeptide repeat protein [Planctomycetota bacterium]